MEYSELEALFQTEKIYETKAEGPCIAIFRGELARLAVMGTIFGVGPRFLYGAALQFTPPNLVVMSGSVEN